MACPRPGCHIHIGEGAWNDDSGFLRRMTDGREGWILVCLDLHVGWTGTDNAALSAIAPHMLGIVTP